MRVLVASQRRDCSGVCPELVVIPQGAFVMGSDEKAESPRVKVTIAKPFALGRYETTFDEYDACVDAGADLVLGHHAHIPKAIEVYRGKAIFYSLSQFCMTKAKASHHWSEAPWKHGAIRNHADLAEDRPLFPYGVDAKMSLLAKAVLSRKGVERVSFLPMEIDREYRPEVLKAGDPRFERMLGYMRWASDGFNCRMHAEGDEIVVGG